jgi:hypothetical protein
LTTTQLRQAVQVPAAPSAVSAVDRRPTRASALTSATQTKRGSKRLRAEAVAVAEKPTQWNDMEVVRRALGASPRARHQRTQLLLSSHLSVVLSAAATG